MIHTRLRFQVSCEFKAKKKNSNTERTATGNPLYIRIMSDPPRASSWTSTCTSTPSRSGAGAGLGRQCECPMLRSMPLTVANFLLLRPGATATTTPFICSSRDYSLRQVGFFFKHFLISLCASAFGSYSVSIPSALCLSVTSTSADPQTEPDTGGRHGDGGR